MSDDLPPDLPPGFGCDAISIALAEASKDDTVAKLVAHAHRLEQELLLMTEGRRVDRIEFTEHLTYLIDSIGKTKELYEHWVADTKQNVQHPIKRKERLRCYNKLVGICQWYLSSQRIWNKALKAKCQQTQN